MNRPENGIISFWKRFASSVHQYRIFDGPLNCEITDFVIDCDGPLNCATAGCVIEDMVSVTIVSC